MARQQKARQRKRIRKSAKKTKRREGKFHIEEEMHSVRLGQKPYMRPAVRNFN